ncbi:substrate-binding domain-containing protein [Kitasatospora sp. NPDC088346]|uniref:substrate-binding domain-containing protein n=1 Tax=Kitasatospora sp. NPDC088346 TaxID=3364073 RepID=UPI0037F7CAAF
MLPAPTYRTKVAALTAIIGLCLSACAAEQSPDGIARVKGTISITYLQKQGDQQYFLDEADGARARAAELGIDLTLVNLGNDAARTVKEVEAAVARKAHGVIVVVPDPAVGPQVAQITRNAKIALLTSDDQICTNLSDPSVCAKQKLAPRVGFSGAQMGAQVGQRAAGEYRKAGWKASDTRVISVWQQDVNVCRERVNAATEAFLNEGQVPTLDIGTDNTEADAKRKVAATIAAEHDAVRHWIVWGCNDENVQGALTALHDSGVSADNVIGVGLGAYLACRDWLSGRPTGMKAALFINGRDVGALAVQTMYNKLKAGTEMPAEVFAPTTMVDATTWKKNSGLDCR